SPSRRGHEGNGKAITRGSLVASHHNLLSERVCTNEPMRPRLARLTAPNSSNSMRALEIEPGLVSHCAARSLTDNRRDPSLTCRRYLASSEWNSIMFVLSNST